MATETIDVVPEAVEADPVHTGGDSDFWGEPQFRTRIWLEHRNKIIYLRLEANWQEPKPDFTAFQVRTRRPLFDIRSKMGSDWYFVAFKDQYDLDLSDGITIPGIDKGMQEIYRSNTGLVNSIFAEGDSYGGWFGGGDHPKILVNFNRIYFDISNQN